LGVTRVEIGVQAPDEKILKLVNRGHGLKEIINATKLLKNAGFKITYHLMPSLPGSSYRKDLKMLRDIFTNPDYKPDNIKFYPTSIVKYSQLEKWYKQGKYQPLDEQTLIKLIVNFKKNIVPPWVRIQRLVRDLTVNDIVVDTFPSNLRQKIESELKKQKITCPCIRCREIKSKLKATKLEFNIIKYQASNGQEYFLQYIDSQNRLYGLLRLRLFNKQAIVRELHVYGEMVPIGQNTPGKTQHYGLGQLLLKKAEDITLKHNIKQLKIISGIGVRPYYHRLGYRLEDTYMVKSWQ
jgi:elongator complex protein 3